MEKKKLSLELLVAAAKDLNSELKLNPEIPTAFDGAALGGVDLINAKRKFATQLGKDLIELGNGKMADGKDMIQATDKVKPETIDLLETLGVEGIRKRMGGTVAKGSKKPGARKKEEAEKKAPAPKKAKAARPDGEWGEGSLCQIIFLAGKVKKPVSEEAVLAEVKKTEKGKKSGNLPGMVKRILNEAVKKGLLVKSDKGFAAV
jgi:hypothetical protein